jgi:HK97 family phage portal protein
VPTFVSNGEIVTAGGHHTGLASPSRPLSEMFDGDGAMPLIGGRVVSYANLYRTQWAVAVAVNKIVRQVSRLPLKPYKRQADGQRIRQRTGQLATLLDTPWRRAGPTHLKQAMMQPALVNGSGALRKVRHVSGGPVVEVKPLTWAKLTAHDVTSTEVGMWETTEAGHPRFIDPGDVILFAFRGLDSPLGVSPLQQLGVTLSIEDAAARHQQAMLRNGARPVTAVEVQKDYLPVDPAKRQVAFGNLRTDIDRLYAGPEQQGKPWLLPPGLTISPVGHTAVEVELIDQRKLAREETFSVYDVPPPLVGLLERSSFNNITELHRMLYVTVLGPWLTLGEETIGAQLIAEEPSIRGGQFVEYDLSEVLKGDVLQRSQALALQIGYGVLTIDEARSIENRPEFGLPETTRPLYPANNLKPVGLDGQSADGSAAAGAPSDGDLQTAAKALAGMPADDVRALLVRAGGSAVDAIYALADPELRINGHHPAEYAEAT